MEKKSYKIRNNEKLRFTHYYLKCRFLADFSLLSQKNVSFMYPSTFSEILSWKVLSNKYIDMKKR